MRTTLLTFGGIWAGLIAVFLVGWHRACTVRKRAEADELTAIAEAAGVLVRRRISLAERQAMRQQLIDDLCADWGREIEYSLTDVVAEWEAS